MTPAEIALDPWVTTDSVVDVDRDEARTAARHAPDPWPEMTAAEAEADQHGDDWLELFFRRAARPPRPPRPRPSTQERRMSVIFYCVIVCVSVFAGILIHALLTASATADLRAQVEQLEAELNFWANR